LERLDKIGNLTPHSRGINLVAKVVTKSEPRSVGSQYDQTQHQLSDLLIADETGAISMVLWDENIPKVNTGDTVKISNAFVKVFRGKMQLNLGRYGKIEISDEPIGEVNTENNLSEKESFQQGGFRRFSGPRRSGERRGRPQFRSRQQEG